jgi:hypothetical protein
VAFSELDLKRIDKIVGGFCRRLSPPEHAHELRTAYEVDGHAVTIFEERAKARVCASHHVCPESGVGRFAARRPAAM